MARTALVYKTSSAEFLDRLYEDPSGLTTAQGLLSAHENDPLSATTEDLNNSHGLSPDAGNKADFDKYWLSGTGPFGGEEVDRVLRHGYGEAIRIASEEYAEPVPIETFWVAGASDHFELHIGQARRCVTVFMFVPTTRGYGSRQAGAQTYVVRAGGLREDGETLHAGVNDQPPIVKVKVSGNEDGPRD